MPKKKKNLREVFTIQTVGQITPTLWQKKISLLWNSTPLLYLTDLTHLWDPMLFNYWNEKKIKKEKKDLMLLWNEHYIRQFYEIIFPLIKEAAFMKYSNPLKKIMYLFDFVVGSGVLVVGFCCTTFGIIKNCN